MSNMKELIIRQMDNGPEILKDIEVNKKYGKDYRLEKGRKERIINRLHPDELELVVSEVIQINPHAKTFRLVSKEGLLPVFQSGQYINIFVEIDGVLTSRPYSISSSSKQGAYYEITIARIASGFVSDYFLDKVKVGDEFTANGPAGTFHYNPVFHKKSSVFIAGGSGITPFMSMTREILESGLDREIHLIYGCRNEDVIFFKDELEHMAKNYKNFNYSIVLSEPPKGYTGLTGFVDAKCIKNLIENIQDHTYYICGPHIMNDFVEEALLSIGIEPRMIRKEMFGARQDIENEPGWPSDLTGKETFSITINNDKKIPALSGESLLTSLERAGVRVKVCCRSGECSLCRVQLVSGKVFMPRGVLLRHADEKFGYIHSCKAYPISDLEIWI